MKSMCPDSVLYLYETLSSEAKSQMLHAQMKFIKKKSRIVCGADGSLPTTKGRCDEGENWQCSVVSRLHVTVDGYNS